MERDEILQFLRRTPALIEGVCRGLSDDQLRRRPGPEAWSLLEIACHLRDSAIEEGLRARRMVEEDNPTLEPYDQLARAIARDYQGQEPAKVMTALRAYWTGYAYQLERFSDAEWERGGVHPRSRAHPDPHHPDAGDAKIGGSASSGRLIPVRRWRLCSCRPSGLPCESEWHGLAGLKTCSYEGRRPCRS
jgi:hypothetical protein